MNSLVKVIPLRWNDFDVLGHVNNVRYFEFMQDTRVALVEKMNLSKADISEDLRRPRLDLCKGNHCDGHF